MLVLELCAVMTKWRGNAKGGGGGERRKRGCLVCLFSFLFFFNFVYLFFFSLFSMFFSRLGRGWCMRWQARE
ncbi:hypothetical protein P168DRAFT_89961 [Aspergillus campestris IBT 28561]|uniref:Uncharacterized protein n=1 Tax=Aspergillus campestris (strain IBT 28561) TaxID=1392248 RepID=A0A2I1DBE1_ASPC2|nr:uncharacterized protein P168DRAFT_89961 [Aspergillus campestris IBT 28561]PKY07183.1 hypothetical protein P168DRAFT_89961 [Aspergillus campestris IBT 28561]